MNIFEQATRLKLRFLTTKGQLSVEDLWDLPLTSKTPTTGTANLDNLAQALHRELKNLDEVSFVTAVLGSGKAAALQLQFDIVKHIIDDKLRERDERTTAAGKAEKRQQLLSLINDKEQQSLQSLSVEELRKQLDNL